jgi:hypothetical protein
MSGSCSRCEHHHEDARVYTGKLLRIIPNWVVIDQTQVVVGGKEVTKGEVYIQVGAITLVREVGQEEATVAPR